jgi:hypothetical protein
MYLKPLTDLPSSATHLMGRRYRQSLLADVSSPLAGAGTPWRAGTFLKDEHPARLSDAELGAAIFRFVFERH